MIRFKNWYITAEKEVIARQHDNLTADWTLWRYPHWLGLEPADRNWDELNVITLEKTEEGWASPSLRRCSPGRDTGSSSCGVSRGSWCGTPM